METSEKLLHATIALLQDQQVQGNLTARQIVQKAGVNLAMIKYCYGSKEQLVCAAINQIMQEDYQRFLDKSRQEKEPKEQLRVLLHGISETVCRYESVTRQAIPYLLLEQEILLPERIRPMITEYYGSEKNETECKILAFELVSFLQLVFYRMKDFASYAGLNMSKTEERNKLIDMQLDLLMKKEK